MYIVDPFQPSSIARYDLASTPIALVRESSPPMARLNGPVFLTSDGASIVLGTGTVLRSSPDAALDMNLRGSLTVSSIESAAHSSTTHDIVTVSSGQGGPRRLTWFDDATLARRLEVALGDDWNAFVAFSSDSSRLYVIRRVSSQWTIYTVTPPP